MNKSLMKAGLIVAAAATISPAFIRLIFISFTLLNYEKLSRDRVPFCDFTTIPKQKEDFSHFFNKTGAIYHFRYTAPAYRSYFLFVECAECFVCIVNIQLGSQLERSVHGKDRHTEVYYIHIHMSN